MCVCKMEVRSTCSWRSLPQHLPRKTASWTWANVQTLGLFTLRSAFTFCLSRTDSGKTNNSMLTHTHTELYLHIHHKHSWVAEQLLIAQRTAIRPLISIKWLDIYCHLMVPFKCVQAGCKFCIEVDSLYCLKLLKATDKWCSIKNQSTLPRLTH